MRQGLPCLLVTLGVATTLVAGVGASGQPGSGVIIRQLAAGTLLIAGRNLPDPNFTETVVLLIDFSDEGAAGLVLNRSSGVALSRAMPSVEAAAGVESPAFIGGPVSRSSVLALSRATCTGCRAIVRDVHLVTSVETLTSLIARNADTGRLRVYAGYAGWGAKQLEAEVRQGAWRVLAADARSVFDPDPASLWQRMIMRTEAVLARWLRPRPLERGVRPGLG